MDRGKMTSAGRGAKSKAPQHPQDIFALGGKSTVVVNRDAEKRNIHKASTSGVERKRETTAFGSQPPTKRSRIGSPAEAVGGTSLEVDPVDLVPNVLQALDTHNSDKLLGLLTGSIRLLKSQRSKPDPILCMSMLYLTKIRPNMFAHETVTQSLCTLLKREQGAAFKSKGNPLVFVLACNMLYAGHKDSNNWPDTFIKVYIEDALNERWWVECAWCKCLVENIITAFSTKHPPPYLIPSDNTLGTMSPSGSGSPLMGSTDEDTDNTELEYSVFPRYSSSYETVEALVLEAIKEQIQRRAAPDAIHKGFLKLLAATCGFPEIRMISASRLEAWLHSGKLWRCAQELLAYVCCNVDACGPTAARDHEVLAQLARMRLKTKPLQAAYQACLREMVSDSPALLRSVVTHTIYNELSNVRSPNNMSVLAALIQAQAQLVPAAMADTYHELLLRPEDYLRPLRALTRECVRAARADAQALLPLARALAQPQQQEIPAEVRERAFTSLADLFCCCCLVTASHSKHLPEYKQQLCGIQGSALGWLLETACTTYKPSRHDFQLALNKIMFVESVESYSKADNWPPECERALTHRLCCEAPLPQHNLLRIIFIGLSKDIPVAPAEALDLVEQLVRRACALPPDDNPLHVDKLELADYVFQLCQFNPPDNMHLPQGYTPPALAITSLYWRGWVLLVMLAAHNPHTFAERAAAMYPTLRSLIEMCITNKPSIEWGTNAAAEAERAESERAAILQLETHLAAASNAKLPVTEHTSRLLSQLTTLDPLAAARKPPQSVIETLQTLSTTLRLGRLLCRQPALLLDLVERHGTRRAMPWLHQLLRHEQLELSVLPVQCLCEFLSAGGGEAGKAGELRAHLRRTAADSEPGARAVLHYYLTRLAHAHAPTRARASRGLKLVLSQSTEETTELDYNADVSPNEWLNLLWELNHWEAVRTEVVTRIRAACLVECIPQHVAAYCGFLARHVALAPQLDHTDLVLDLSQLLMERTTVISSVLPPAELRDPPAPPQPLAHHTLNAITSILYTHMRQVRSNTEDDPEVLPPAEPAEGGSGEAAWAGGERVVLQWARGRRVTLHCIVAHAHLKLLCYGPSIYDTNQEMYSWLQSVWVGNDAPTAFLPDSSEEAALLPDWLRLHLVRSARPPLLEAGLRALPAHKLALFIQTFGMPVASMSALLSALDACPAGAVVRLGVERAYMAQLLVVQRARGARGGAAFAAALQLAPKLHAPDDMLFADEELPPEPTDAWETLPIARLPTPYSTGAPPPELVPALLATVFEGAGSYPGNVDTAFTHLIAAMSLETKRFKAAIASRSLDPTLALDCPSPYLQYACAFLQRAPAQALAAHDAQAAALLRALLPAAKEDLARVPPNVLEQHKNVSARYDGVLRVLERVYEFQCKDFVRWSPQDGTRDRLVAELESATPSTLEASGNKMIEENGTEMMVSVISHLLERSQEGYYETRVKSESGQPEQVPLFARGGLGCGLLLHWLSSLRQKMLGAQPESQHMYVSGRNEPARDRLVAELESATPSTLEASGNKMIETHSTRMMVDVISLLLERSQEGYYETRVKSESGQPEQVPLFARGGLGCGLLLDWLSSLQHETLGEQPERQMRLMFRPGCASWRPQLVTQLAHRASWRTLHAALRALLDPDQEWAASGVVEFCATLMDSPRIWQGRDRSPASSPSQHRADLDTLQLTHKQLGVLIRYVIQEAEAADRAAGGGAAGAEAMRRRMEARLPLVLRCSPSPPALLAHAIDARSHPRLLLLLYMKVPAIQQLVWSCEEYRGACPGAGRAWGALGVLEASAVCTSSTDKVSHTLLTSLAAHAHASHHHSKEHTHKLSRMEAVVRSVWARVWGAGARALPLAGALLRGTGAPAHAKHHHYLLGPLEVLPDEELFHSEEIHGILDCFLSMARQSYGRDTALVHRVCALLRRYLARKPARAQALLRKHRDTVANTPALSALTGAEVTTPASTAPPPHALLALQRRTADPTELHWLLQEIETWGTRRGGAWGGPAHAHAILRACAPLAAHAHPPLRLAALSLLPKLLPAVADTRPGLEAVMECLDSSQPEVTASMLEKLPDIMCGMQEHLARVLVRVFELGLQSRQPVDACLARCVATVNLHRGC